MTTKEFIDKWNVGYENSEQQLDFEVEMREDLESLWQTKWIRIYQYAIGILLLITLVLLNPHLQAWVIKTLDK